MPLIDHFRKPTETYAPWSSVWLVWVAGFKTWMNTALPRDRYWSLITAGIGSPAEYDASQCPIVSPTPEGLQNTEPVSQVAPAPRFTFGAPIPDEYTLRVYDDRAGGQLVGAVEFVSPSNKDRPQDRTRFVSKCLGHLSAGAGVVVVDIVASRTANIHNELMTALDGSTSALLPAVPTYVAGYRPTLDYYRLWLDTWAYSVPVGTAIPSVPLVLKDGPTVMLDLEGTYTEAAAEHRL